MNERPILFSGAMVRAILDGRKTQTRRVITPQPEHGIKQCHFSKSGWAYLLGDGGKCSCKPAPNPYGAPGDRLWVRETWADVHPIQIIDRYSQPGRAGIPGPPPVKYRTIYRADGEYPPIWPSGNGYPYRTLVTDDAIHLEHFPKGIEYGWEPSIHMPRWASRITLEVVGVRVERVQDISEVDAWAEGIESVSDPTGHFADLWDSINAKRGYGWDVNPWVWVVEFRRV